MGLCLFVDLPRVHLSLPACIFSYLFAGALHMSTTNLTAGSSQSNDKFTAIFQAALNEYQRSTGKPLDTHPFATQLDGCNSPEATLNVFLTQAQAFSKFRQSDEKLMKLLDPMVHIIFTFSETLGEGIGLVRRCIRPILSFSQRPSLRHFHPRKRSSPVSAFFSRCVSSLSPLSRVCVTFELIGSEGRRCGQ